MGRDAEVTEPDEPELAYIRCLRVTEISRPMAGSEIRQCGEDVWFDARLTDEIGADSALVIHCRQCVAPAGAEIKCTPGQVRRLRAEGVTDEQIAELIAAAETAGPAGDIRLVFLQVETFPRSAIAETFRAALVRARTFVALTT
jgi:hypothetical protein